jgi:hypothetical protein
MIGSQTKGQACIIKNLLFVKLFGWFKDKRSTLKDGLISNLVSGGRKGQVTSFFGDSAHDSLNLKLASPFHLNNDIITIETKSAPKIFDFSRIPPITFSSCAIKWLSCSLSRK